MHRSRAVAVGLVAAVGLLVGCAGPTFIVQQYGGPVRPRETIAVLRANATDDARLLVLDDQDIAAPIADDGRLHIEVLPARHTVVAGRSSEPRRRYPSVAFQAEADHVYRVVFASDEPHVYEVDRSNDTLLRDVTERAEPAAPPPGRPPPPPPPPPPPTEPSPAEPAEGVSSDA